MTGSTEDPDDPAAVAVSIFMAVIVYAVRYTPFISPVERRDYRDAQDMALSVVLTCRLQVFLVFCAFQAYLHVRESKRGAISLN